MTALSAFEDLNRIACLRAPDGHPAALLEAARRERARIVALADLLCDLDEFEADAGGDVIFEAMLLFRDIAGAAAAGSALLEPLLGQPSRRIAPAVPASPEPTERNSHDHPLA